MTRKPTRVDSLGSVRTGDIIMRAFLFYEGVFFGLGPGRRPCYRRDKREVGLENAGPEGIRYFFPHGPRWVRGEYP